MNNLSSNRLLAAILFGLISTAGATVAVAAPAEDVAVHTSTTTSTITTDADALGAIAALNEHELRVSNLAKTKAKSDPVMQYAQMMENEHQSNKRKLRNVSDDTGIQPVDSSSAVQALKDKTEAERDHLADNTGGLLFDAAYVQAMVDGHTEALLMIDEELLPIAQDPKVIAFLRETREDISKHLSRAQELKNSMAAL